MIVNKLVSAYESFSFQLLSLLLKQDPDTNVFISPFSVGIAFAMIYNGARGITEQTIAKVFGLTGLNIQEINAANKSLMSIGDGTDTDNQLGFANAIWVRPDILLNNNFVQQLQEAYNSEVANLDFPHPGAAITINKWVEEKTHDKIKQLVTPDDIVAAILVLINTIYFKGTWTYLFDKQKTKEQSFTLPNGSHKSHPMMSQSGQYLYYETEKFQAVSLPYENRHLSMYIFLPQLSSSIKEFQQLLTVENWRIWMSQFDKIEGDIVLPRFKIEYSKILNDALINLGMGEAFSADANFEGIGAGNLKISKVIHKAIIEVNEEGTEAAAATAVVMARSMGFTSRFRMIIDRPFFHAIRDNQTGALLFMGFVFNPVE